MAEVLLIERADLVKFTVVDGNVDTDRFIQFIKIAQDIHIQSYLGTDLLNKLKADIEAGTLSPLFPPVRVKHWWEQSSPFSQEWSIHHCRR